jgi:WXG100 family type VII secretion target
MTKIDFSTDDVKTFAGQMDKAGKGIRTILAELDKNVKEVESKWGGDSQQNFKRFYQEWRKGMDLHLTALEKSGGKLNEMAEKYPQIS